VRSVRAEQLVLVAIVVSLGVYVPTGELAATMPVGTDIFAGLA
jgi:hypothetical protein